MAASRQQPSAAAAQQLNRSHSLSSSSSATAPLQHSGAAAEGHTRTVAVQAMRPAPEQRCSSTATSAWSAVGLAVQRSWIGRLPAVRPERMGACISSTATAAPAWTARPITERRASCGVSASTRGSWRQASACLSLGLQVSPTVECGASLMRWRAQLPRQLGRRSCTWPERARFHRSCARLHAYTQSYTPGRSPVSGACGASGVVDGTWGGPRPRLRAHALALSVLALAARPASA